MQGELIRVLTHRCKVRLDPWGGERGSPKSQYMAHRVQRLHLSVAHQTPWGAHETPVLVPPPTHGIQGQCKGLHIRPSGLVTQMGHPGQAPPPHRVARSPTDSLRKVFSNINLNGS